MDLQLEKEKKFYSKRELASFQMYFAMEVVLLFLTLNGWKILNTSDGDVYLEK